MHTVKHFCLFLTLLALSLNLFAQKPPKREFRGTWVHTVGQGKYAKMSTQEMKTYFTRLLDGFQRDGINVVLFQVRPEADAWYASSYEPWSRYITGTQGLNPGWDPLEFMVKECHKRNMDIHAWLNPYRVRSSPKKELSPNHIYFKHKDWFVNYGNFIWFDPGNPECREFIKVVVKDIVKRYDVDAIHMDDYFYPYPIVESQFDDSRTYQKFGLDKGFKSKADWRRENVNLLIRDLHQVIHETKPWVEFGVSPFGIYRNRKNDPNGSQTNGLSNYDDLFADILYWLKMGWVDYNIPQLYWEIGHRVADYQILLDWWSKNSYDVPLYIGQDVLRTLKPDSLKRNQLKKKMEMVLENRKVTGNCFWPGYELERNAGGVCDSLQKIYHKYPALHPANNSFDQTAPKTVQKLTYLKNKNKTLRISWDAPAAKSEMDKAAYYAIYKFKTMGDVDLDDPRNLVAITRDTYYTLPTKTSAQKVFVITALDRCHNESRGEFIRITD